MKITAIRATPVNLELEAPYVWVFGELPGFTVTIVEVETDAGLTGIGETTGAAAARIIAERMAPRLVGRDAFDIAGAEALCLPWWTGVQSTNDHVGIAAFGAIDMALWDLRGKAWGQPLYRLLGGAVRDTVAFTDYFSFRADGPGVRGERTVDEVVDYCARLQAEYGTSFFEGKLSTEDPAPSLALVRALRRRLGDTAMLRIDSNMGYSLATARRLIRPLEELGVRNWEEPVATFEAMAELRRHTTIPFSSHNLDLPRAVAVRAPDAIVTNPTLLGGIGRFVRFVGAAEAMGVDVWCYSGDSGIGTACYLHLCAALAHLREPNQSLLRMQPTDVIEEGPFSPRDNMLPVPQGAGLGVTLSAERLAWHHNRFLSQGSLDKYHDPQRPGRFRALPLA